MSNQLISVPSLQPIGLPGQLVGTNNVIRTYRNGRALVAKIVDVTITAVNTTLYGVTINGILIGYTSDGSATTQEIRDNLITNIAANAFAAAFIVGTSGGAAVLRLTEVAPAGGEVTISVGANLSAAEITAHQSTEPLKAGVAVDRDDAHLDNGCRKPAASGVRLGVVVASPSHVLDEDPSTEENYAANSEIPVLVRGSIYVRVTEAVTPTSTVCVRTAAVTGKEVGTFGDTDDGNTEPLTGARFRTSGAALDVVILDLNLN